MIVFVQCALLMEVLHLVKKKRDSSEWACVFEINCEEDRWECIVGVEFYLHTQYKYEMPVKMKFEAQKALTRSANEHE